MQKIAGIYKLTSPSGKCYIGQRKDLKTRMQYYKRNSCKRQTLLYNALIKYGFEAFKIEYLFETEVYNIDELNILEEKYILEYESLSPNGYNLLKGGNNREVLDETKERISKSKIGDKNPMYGKCGELHHNFGKTLSEDTKEKLKQYCGEKHSQFGKTGELCPNFGKLGVLHHNSKKVCQYTLSGEFIKEWDSIADVKREVPKCKGIQKVIDKDGRTAGGFKWKYKE